MDSATPRSDERASVSIAEVFSALSFALDITEGHPLGHALRTCLIGMRLADRMGLPLTDRRDLYYALMLKDVGCSSNAARVFELFGGDERAAKRDRMRVDWPNYFKAARFAMAHAAPGASWYQRARRVASLAAVGPRAAAELVRTRCERGSDIVTRLGFTPQVAAALGALDEHWDGHGQPRGLRGAEIPLGARIIGLAQTLEVFAALEGPRSALELARSRSGRWFDPTLVTAAQGLESELTHWNGLDEHALQQVVRDGEPGDAALLAGPGTLDRIAEGFAAVVDAKSPYTATHSGRVTAIALDIAKVMGFEPAQLAELRRAGLLHDLGKLSVPNSILDKPSALNAEEWELVRLHPYFTECIIERISGFRALARVAGSHHERLDGRGYHRRLRGDEIPPGGRVLAVADMFEALTANRPYRPALPEETALRILEAERGVGLDADCLDGLIYNLERGTVPEAEKRAA
ncbi:MAG: HD domain-containing protein [Candidatus Eisenbacteria bacterium]|uniref:HD domain-containing protein n=1 Tax=Eiseniibacteriota bacterium TaxID=2212470 RepID=A0A538UD12_UNCEI|nr:MAG: HD domain-containing protein [Candidatus Eisenbacteria bacterium]